MQRAAARDVDTARGILLGGDGRVADVDHAVAIGERARAAARVGGDFAAGDGQRAACGEHGRAYAVEAGAVAAAGAGRFAGDRAVGQGHVSAGDEQRVLVVAGRGDGFVRDVGILRNGADGAVAFGLAAARAAVSAGAACGRFAFLAVRFCGRFALRRARAGRSLRRRASASVFSARNRDAEDQAKRKQKCDGFFHNSFLPVALFSGARVYYNAGKWRGFERSVKNG